MSNPNLGHQFTAYRGLIVARGPVPDSDEEILGHLRSKGPDIAPSGIAPGGIPGRYYSHPFGEHWTTDRSVAERFATLPNAGGYEKAPVHARQFSGHEHYGVVLEGQVSSDRTHRPQNMGIWRGESEVAPKNHELISATAHVVSTDRRGRFQEHRSFEVPTEKWR